jgi:hypothetical protein
MRSFEFTETHSLVVMLQAAELLLVEGLSEDGVNCFLKVEIEKWKLANPDIPNYHCVAQQIPKSVNTVLVRLGLSHSIIHATCCPSCFAIYPRPIRPTAHKKLRRKKFQPHRLHIALQDFTPQASAMSSHWAKPLLLAAKRYSRILKQLVNTLTTLFEISCIKR